MFGILGVIGTLLSSAITIITPVLKAAVELLLWYLKKLWEGIVDMSDNLGSVLLVCSVFLGGMAVGKYWHPMSKPTATKPGAVTKPKRPAYFDSPDYLNLPSLKFPTITMWDVMRGNER